MVEIQRRSVRSHLARAELLGPVRAWSDAGQEIELRSPRLQLLFALLCLHANAPVQAETLVAELWGSSPPSSAANLVHTYIARLRRSIQADAPRFRRDGLLSSTRGAYALTLPVQALDVSVFEQELDRAAKAASSGDVQSARATLDVALSRWRGEPFAGLDAPSINAERQRITQRWILGKQLQFELHLKLEPPAPVIPELYGLVARYPTRERLVELLMTALYLDGRRAEAIAVYDQTRRLLDDELGVDPSPRLQDRYVAILRSDVGPEHHRPDIGAAAKEPAVIRPPAQLPPATPWFVGRVDVLKWLDELRGDATGQPAPRVIALTGTAGVGKTALAVHWAHSVAAAFPDGQLYVNLRGFSPSADALPALDAVRGFLEALGVSAQRMPGTAEAQIGRYRSLLAGRRMLILLDNARDAEHVRPLLPGTPTALVLVTSRHQLTSLIALDGADAIPLDVLPVDEARALLSVRLGADRTAADTAAVDRIIAACARLPLALVISAARARQTGFDLATIAAELAPARTALDVLHAGDAPSEIRSVLSWSYAALDEPTARLFRLLGLAPGPDIGLPAAMALADLPGREARRALTGLVQANLVSEHQPDRYTYHDLLRAYAAQLAKVHDDEPARRAATERLLDNYCRQAYAAAILLHPARDPIPLPLAPPVPGANPRPPADHEGAAEWLTAERTVLLAAVQQAATFSFDPHCWQLAWSLDTFLYRQGYWTDAVQAWTAALTAAERLGEPALQATAHRRIARALTMLTRHGEAERHLQRALECYAEAADASGQAHTLHALAYLCGLQAEPVRALEFAEHAGELFERTGDRRGHAYVLNSIGWYHALLGDYVAAVRHCERALALFQQAGESDGQALSWDSLGYAHQHAGRHRRAIECYQHALDLLRTLGDRFNQATTLVHLGDTHQEAGDPRAAREAWSEALHILTDLDHPDADGVRERLHRCSTESSNAAARN